MEELEQDIDFSSAIVGAQKPAPVKKKVQPQVASSTTLDSKSVSQPTKSLSGSQLKEDKEEIGIIDDLWNTLKGAGVKTLANIASIPAFAQNAALDIVASATGRSSEFNKLPSSVKKQIRDSLSATTPMGQMAETSQEATDFLNKKSEDIYKKTRQQQVDVVDELSKFKDNPNAESVKKILYQGLKSTVESLPAIASYSINPALLGVSVAAGKRSDDITESKGDVGIGDLINAGIYGVVEQKTEGITRGIIGKAISNAVGSPTAARAIAEGVVTSVVKDMGLEGLSEGATTLIQETSDKITKGEEINISDILKKSANSAVLGLIGSGGISLAGEGVGAARRYVASKIISKDQREKLNNNLNTIQSLNLEHGDDVDPRVNKIVNKKIDELVAENEAIMAENEAIASNLSADQVKQIFDIDDKLEDNFNSAKSIIDDASMDKSAKELLLDDLLKQQNNLKQQKDAVQKQTTSEVPVQPEAGVGGEVAEGITQAEPQGTAEEIKVEEEVTPTEAIEVFHGGNLPSLEEGKPLYVSEDSTQANEYAKMSDGEVSKFFLDKGKIADEADAYSIMEELDLPTDANFFELIDPRFEESLPEEDIKKVFDALKERGFEAVRYTDIDQKTLKPGIQNILVIDASKSLKSEPVVAEEQVKPTEMSTQEWGRIQKLVDNISNGEEITLPEDLQLQQNYPQTIEKLLASKVQPVVQQPLTEITKLSDEQKSAIQEGVKLGNDMVKRYPKQDDLITKYKALQKFQKKNQQYIDANQSQRDEMTRQINYSLGLTLKKSAPSPKRILGIKPTMVSVDEMKSLQEQLLLQEKAAKSGVDFANKAKKIVNNTIKGLKKGALDPRATNALLTALDANAETPEQRRDIISKVIAIFKKSEGKIAVDEIKLYNDQIKIENKASQNANKIRNEVIDKIKSFVTRGVLSKAQQKSLLNSLAKTNILNPVMRDRLFERMQKMFERADYQDRVKEATIFRNRIKKLAKSDTLQASVAKMAKDFAKVIPEFTDIDTYLDNAREVYGAIKKPIRVAAVLEKINNFSKTEIQKQEERLKNTLLDQYNYLVEEGSIDASMSLAEIQKYILDVENGVKPDAKANEEQIRANISELFDSMTEVTDSILEDGYNPLINEEVELDAYTKKLIKNFTSMDLSRLSVADAYRATEALDNYLTNDIVDNMEAIYKVYEGGLEAKSIEDQKIVAQDFRRLFGGKAMNFLSRAWTAAFSPVKSTLDLVHRSRSVGSKVFDAMGLRTLSNEASRAKTEANAIDKAYVEKFDKKKPNGKDFRDVENVFERGIYAHLKRTIKGNAEQVAAEFTRRKDQVVLTIDALLKSEDEKLVKRGKVLESIFGKMKDANDISEVESVIDPINKDAVTWWNSVYDKYYPEVKKIASSVYNTVLEDDVNYTPDNYEKIIEEEETDVDKVKTFKMAFDFLNQQKSGTLMKNNYIKGIPQNRVISFDFDYNNSSAFGKMLTDVRTAPSMLQYKGFVQSPSFKKIYPNTQDRQVIQDKLNYYVNEVRSKNVATGSVDAKKFAKVIQAVSRYGTSRALGSFTAGIKQAGTALVNTSIALANDPKSVTKGIGLLFNKDAQNFLENSGYGIANRGLESQTAIESANRTIEQTDVNSANKLADAIAKAGKIYLEYSLKNGDVLAARASWYAYYLHDLKKQGVDTTNIDWKNHELNKKAADYAEDQINLQQNVSDASMMGKFLTSKNPYVTITRSMVLPFSSFIFNAKDKITTDVTILTSKNSNNLDKIDAAKSLAATGAEMIMFEALSATISSGIVIAANSILGIDEDEEAVEKRRDQYFKSAITRFTTDVLSPIPNLGDKAIVALVNKLLDLAQSDLDEEEKFKLFEYKPQSEVDAMLNIVGGIPEIASKPLIDMGDTIYKITSDSYTDRFGNEIELSYEDKSKLMYVLAVELLAATNILPAEVVRINEKVKQQIEKEAR